MSVSGTFEQNFGTTIHDCDLFLALPPRQRKIVVMAEVLSALVPTALMLIFAVGIGLYLAYFFRRWLSEL
jgi:hypothetical protein